MGLLKQGVGKKNLSSTLDDDVFSLRLNSIGCANLLVFNCLELVVIHASNVSTIEIILCRFNGHVFLFNILILQFKVDRIRIYETALTERIRDSQGFFSYFIQFRLVKMIRISCVDYYLYTIPNVDNERSQNEKTLLHHNKMNFSKRQKIKYRSRLFDNVNNLFMNVLC